MSGGNEFALPLPAELVDALAERVAERVAATMPTPRDPYMNVDEAAEYIACGKKRIYELKERGAVACYQDGKRLLFRREDLDAYVTSDPTQFANGHRPRGA